MEKKKAVLMLCATFPRGHRREGEPTDFEANIRDGVKIHTVRGNAGDTWWRRCTDVMRGRKYLTVREWTGKPYHSEQREIARYDTIGLQKITMTSASGELPQCWVDGHKVEVERVAANDGLPVEDFVNWFLGGNKDGIFEGVIIHFTDFRY